MAEKPAPKIENQTTEDNVKSKKKLFIIIGTLLAVTLSVGFAFYLLNPMGNNDKKEKKVSKKPEKAIYLPLEAFTVNLTSSESSYLQTEITLQTKSEKQSELLKSLNPAIRSKIILLLSGKTPEDLYSLDGKNNLRLELKSVIEEILPEESDDHEIVDVLLTSFIIQ